MKNINRSLVAVGALSLAGVSQAATDIAAITAAQTDGLAVAAALTAMSIAVWAALFIKRKFFG